MSIRRMMAMGLTNYVRGLIDAMRIRIKPLHGVYEADSCLENDLNEINKFNLLTDASLVITPNGYNENILHTLKGNTITTPYNLASFTESAAFTAGSAGINNNLNTTDINPFGVAKSIRFISNAANSAHRITTYPLSLPLGFTTFSFYLKKGIGATAPDVIQLILQRGGSIDTSANFNVSTGALGTTTNCTSAIDNTGLTAGWWRCSITVNTTTVLGSNNFGLAFCNNNISAGPNPTYVDATTSDILAFGAQIETGSVATTYQPVLFTQLLEQGYLQHTRSTTAYRLESGGLVREVPQENLIPYSTELNLWSNVNFTVQVNAINAPDGTLTADASVRTGASGRHQIAVSSYYTLLNSGNYVFSVYVKVGTATSLTLSNNAAFTSPSAVFDLTNISISSTAGVTATITDEGDGWMRCAIYATGVVMNNVMIRHNGTLSTIGCYLWGVQVTNGTTLQPFYQSSLRTNTPRIDYTDGSCPTILLEQQVTNRVLRSEEFNNASWTKTNLTVTSDTEIAPNGFATADTLTATSNNAILSQNSTNIITTPGVGSIFLKRKTGVGDIIIECGQTSSIVSINSSTWTRCSVVDTIITGATYSIVAGLHTITTSSPHNLVTGDSIRFVLVTIATGSGAASTNQVATVTGANTFTFNFGAATATGTCNIIPQLFRLRIAISGDEVYAWGAQLETTATNLQNNYYEPTSYIPTTTAAATRITDFASLYKIRDNNLLNNTFTIFFEVKKIGGGGAAEPHFGLSDTNLSTIASIPNGVFFNGMPLSIIKRETSVTTIIVPTTVYQPIATNYYKGLITCNNGVVEIWVDGSKLVTNTISNYTLWLLLLMIGANNGISRYKYVYGWNRVLTRAEIDLLFEYPYFNAGYTPINNELQQIINRANYEGFTLPSNSILSYCDTLITEMKNDGVWSVGDVYFNFAYNDINLSDFARINWKNPYGGLGIATLNGTVTYQVDGFKGNGVDGYINTRFNPFSGGFNYTLNNAGRFLIVSQQNTGVLFQGDGIITNSNNRMTLFGGNAYIINAGNSGISTNAGGTGLKGIMRYASNNILAINTSVTTTGSTASTSLANSNQLILNSSGNCGDACISNYYMGASLTNTQVQNFRTYYNTFLTNVGLTAFA